MTIKRNTTDRTREKFEFDSSHPNFEYKDPTKELKSAKNKTRLRQRSAMNVGILRREKTWNGWKWKSIEN